MESLQWRAAHRTHAEDGWNHFWYTDDSWKFPLHDAGKRYDTLRLGKSQHRRQNVSADCGDYGARGRGHYLGYAQRYRYCVRHSESNFGTSLDRPGTLLERFRDEQLDLQHRH